jgi:hypothetical protein
MCAGAGAAGWGRRTPRRARGGRPRGRWCRSRRRSTRSWSSRRSYTSTWWPACPFHRISWFQSAAASTPSLPASTANPHVRTAFPSLSSRRPARRHLLPVLRPVRVLGCLLPPRDPGSLFIPSKRTLPPLVNLLQSFVNPWCAIQEPCACFIQDPPICSRKVSVFLIRVDSSNDEAELAR